MPYYFHGSDRIYVDNGSLGASFNPYTVKCPNCHRETSSYSDKCEICDYNFRTGEVDKYICPNCKRQISSKLVKCIMCNYDFITGEVDYSRKNCYEKSKNIVKKICPECGKSVNEKFVKCVYCGHDFRLNKFKDNNSKNLKNELINCPNCNKKQKYSNNFCEICGCDLDLIDFNFDNEILLNNLLTGGFKIPQDKYDVFLKDKFYNNPIYCDDMDNLYERSIFQIKTKFKKGSVLYVSLNNGVISKIIRLLTNEGFGKYINNPSIFSNNNSLLLINSLFDDFNKLNSLNNYFIDKFSLRLPNDIDSNKYIIGFIKYTEAKYLLNEDIDKVNDFIKIYWNYWKFITSTNMELSSSKLYANYIDKLKNFMDIYEKYFEKTEFNVPILNLINILKWILSFSEMIDKLKVNKKINNDLNTKILKNDVEHLEILINSIESKLDKLYSNKDFLNKSFEELNENLMEKIDVIKNLEDRSIVLMNINDALLFFNNSDILFDYVIFDENLSIDNETKLKLFLISKNKLSSVKLWYK